ncbi:hypothetical protein GCM10011380_09420 [Sphingomonas metalli]|uniref:Uncharacterized protein n=1 Tax=Sphingomonas metalli TaxID=1779358 RepID=A0A916SZS3_9SPHN|nr:hypothetical protein [Sphingomonas metalli]GGB21971.1 hypothetical protein GCM10011380_09420 [Sphingomonas metalli]
MLHAALPLSILSLASTAMAFADLPDASAQVTIHERITIRVPRMVAAPIQRIVAPRRDWKERKGPKCLGMTQLAAAAITSTSAIDLLLADGRWMRARLDGDCRSADFYSGLYLRPGSDGQICAKRDVIRIRSGAKCAIEAFRTLQPR